MTSDDKILCQTPTPGKQPTRIERWKYEAVRRAILQALPTEGEGLLFKALPQHVKRNLAPEALRTLGSVAWYTTTVKLDLEVRGEVTRIAGSRPQRLLRAP